MCWILSPSNCQIGKLTLFPNQSKRAISIAARTELLTFSWSRIDSIIWRWYGENVSTMGIIRRNSPRSCSVFFSSAASREKGLASPHPSTPSASIFNQILVFSVAVPLLMVRAKRLCTLKVSRVNCISISDPPNISLSKE